MSILYLVGTTCLLPLAAIINESWMHKEPGTRTLELILMPQNS
jgi:hypothetical protein